MNLSQGQYVAGSVLRDTPNYHGTIPVAHRTAVGEWKPTARGICSMLHAADIRGRWDYHVGILDNLNHEVIHVVFYNANQELEYSLRSNSV